MKIFTPNRDGRKAAVEELTEILKKDPRSHVIGTEYIVTDHDNDYVMIQFEGGGQRRVNVSGNSVGSTIKEVTVTAYWR